MQNDKKVIALFILILAFGMLARSITLTKSSTAEPDALVYLDMAQQTLANHWVVPRIDIHSGFSPNNPYLESNGLVYLALIFYPLLHSVQYSMYLMQAVFALASMAIVYLFAKELSGSTKASLFAMFIYATLPVAIYKNAINVWRGDSFTPILLAASLLCLVYFIKWHSQKSKRWYYCTAALILSVLLISLSYGVWNGGIYALATYITAIFILSHEYLFKDLKLDFLLVLMLLAAGWYAYSLTSYYPASNNNAMYRTTSELQPTSFIYLLSGTLFAVPLALFGLFGFFASEDKLQKAVPYLTAFVMLAIAIPEASVEVRFVSLIAIPLAIFSGEALHLIGQKIEAIPVSYDKLARFFWIIVAASILLSVYQPLISATLPEVSASYHSNMLWIRNNTPSNTTFLTDWDDGSAIEGWGQRESYTDTVIGENSLRIQNFSDFLYADSGNLSYVAQVHPDYLLVRTYWVNLEQSIQIQGGPRIANATFNGTNFQTLLEAPNTITGNGVTLRKIFNQNGTIIYAAQNYSSGG
jgi:asparagine N-glycosylation enzyme membrane subunit Stt3